MWSYKNPIVINPGKYHYLIIDKDITNEFIELCKKTLHAETEQELFAVILDKDLKFQSHTLPIIKTARNHVGVQQKILENWININTSSHCTCSIATKPNLEKKHIQKLVFSAAYCPFFSINSAVLLLKILRVNVNVFPKPSIASYNNKI